MNRALVTLVFASLSFFAQADSVTLRDGLNGYAGTTDTYLYSTKATTNYGNATVLQEQTNARGTLVRFKVFQSEDGPVPDGAVIDNATLRLYKYSGGATTYEARRLLQDWGETQATWRNRLTGTTWSVYGATGTGTGGDIAATADGTGVTSSSSGWLSLPVTPGVQAWRDGAANYGWHLLSTGGATNTKSFRSRNYASNVSQRPTLEITYHQANQAPTVNLITPADGTAVAEGQPVALEASATDGDGSISQVAFYDGADLIAVVNTAPYVTTWLNAAAGSHTLTAKGTDNQGSTSTSTPVQLTVTEAPATTLYYIEPDHLGTPRVITNEAGITVWRWVNLEPFGDSPPETDPDGDGERFVFNLRLPGQYYDVESGMHYNYFRDYDPSVGRYIQSDPIGLDGGINTYAYVNGNPVSLADPTGLAPKTDGYGGQCFTKIQSRLNGGSCPDWTDCLVCCGELMPPGFDEAILVCTATCKEGLEKWKKNNQDKCCKK